MDSTVKDGRLSGWVTYTMTYSTVISPSTYVNAKCCQNPISSPTNNCY